MSANVTLKGRLTGDPELRFTPSGKAVANFTVVTCDVKKNQQTNEWEESNTTFWRCSVWDKQAENVAESLSKGSDVLVEGKCSQREYTTKEGEKRTTFEVQAWTVAASLKNATATVKKAERQGASSGRSSAPADDPWASTPAPASSGGGWGNTSDEPPF